jgi:membrane protease YdiL (CAAX protease family)
MLEFNWFDHIVAFFVLVFVPLMSLKSKPSNHGDEEIPIELPPKIHLFYSNAFLLIIGCLLVLTSWNLSHKPWELLGFQYPVIEEKVIYLSVILLVLYIGETVYGFINRDYLNRKIEELSYIVPLNRYEYKHFVFLAFAAGICEEIVFRGFLIRYLEVFLAPLSYSAILAIIIPGLAFAISHIYQGWWSVLKIFIIALLFGYIFYLSGSLLWIVIIHILVDLVSGSMGLLRTSKK